MCRFEWFSWDYSGADRGKSRIEIEVEQRNDLILSCPRGLSETLTQLCVVILISDRE